MFKKSAGFTLVELLIVVAIIAILAAIAVPSMIEAQTRAKVSRVFADLRTNRIAVEAYAVDQNVYPRMSWGQAPFGDTYEGQGSPFQPISGTLGYWMTTPIAYLQQFDNLDPFATSIRIQADARIYTYHDAKTRRFIQSVSPGNPYTPEDNQAFADNFGEYALMSIGPDVDLGPFYIQYDPTNGTSSPGNIWFSQKNQDLVEVKFP
jgi:prepilin-type N-terminal cleavage/methylation domain-containing protein